MRKNQLQYATLGTAQDFAQGLDAAIERLSFENVGWFGLAATLFTTSRYSVIGLFLIYKFVPNRHFNTWFTLGAATLTSIALMILQAGFAWSSQNLLNYNQVYGSLASFPLFLLWLYLVWYTILLGAILVATLTPMGEDKTQKHFLKIETLRPPH